MKLLIVTRYFPPDGAVGGNRPAKLAEHLPAFGVHPVVLTYPGEPLPSAACPVLRVAPWTTPLDLWAKWKNRDAVQRSAAGASGPAVNIAPRGGLRDNLGYLLQTPDKHIGWYFPAARAAARLIMQGDVDAILTTAPPFSVHLVGLRLKRNYPKVRWIADFRDPWTGEQVMRQYLPEWRNRWERRMEQDCIATADAVICNTPEMRDHMTQLHSAHAAKFVAITNGFDPRQPLGVKPPGNRLRFLHLGSLYGGRKADALLRAAASLVRSGALGAQQIEIRQVGAGAEAFGAVARDVAPELVAAGAITWRDSVPRAEAEEELADADVLLVLQGEHRLQIPAKFFEALAARKPVLALAAPGALTRIVDETGAGHWAPADDEVAIAEVLLQGLKQPRVHRNEEAVAAYWWDGLARRLAAVVKGETTSTPASQG